MCIMNAYYARDTRDFLNIAFILLNKESGQGIKCLKLYRKHVPLRTFYNKFNIFEAKSYET